MTNVAHSALTGASLHEPKGVAAATSGQVYVADGAASGAWTTVAGIVFTGMVADFTTPVAPSGWLELDGTAISTTTYADLYAAMAIQQSGVRVGGLAVITGLSSTTNMKVGYYVFGTGIASGTTVLTVDSATQITMSANASSSGTATVAVSPWLITSTTITLPDVKTVGRYRRSRTTTTQMGTVQADQNLAHTHTGTTASGGSHTPAGTVTKPTITVANGSDVLSVGVSNPGVPVGGLGIGASVNITASLDSTPTFTGTAVSAHTHTFTSASTGSTEARPLSVVFMTCVKY